MSVFLEFSLYVLYVMLNDEVTVFYDSTLYYNNLVVAKPYDYREPKLYERNTKRFYAKKVPSFELEFIFFLEF